jgi:uncharacterized integral membrane protein
VVQPPRRHVRITRDAITYSVALVGIIYEVVTVVSVHRAADPVLLAFLGGLLGLPTFLNRDEKRNDSAGGSDDSPSA